MAETGDRIKAYILNQFLPGADPAELAFDTPLITSGILDSLTILTLRAWIEEDFGVELESHELDFDDFSDIASIERLVQSKRSP